MWLSTSTGGLRTIWKTFATIERLFAKTDMEYFQESHTKQPFHMYNSCGLLFNRKLSNVLLPRGEVSDQQQIVGLV